MEAEEEEEADAISVAELPFAQIKHPKSVGNAESRREVVSHFPPVGLIELASNRPSST